MLKNRRHKRFYCLTLESNHRQRPLNIRGILEIAG